MLALLLGQFTALQSRLCVKHHHECGSAFMLKNLSPLSFSLFRRLLSRHELASKFLAMGLVKLYGAVEATGCKLGGVLLLVSQVVYCSFFSLFNA